MDSNTQAALDVVVLGLGGFIAQKLHAYKKIDDGFINLGLMIGAVAVYIWAAQPSHITLFDVSNAVTYALAAVGGKTFAVTTGMAQPHNTIN
jgi:hypothetical protein